MTITMTKEKKQFVLSKNLLLKILVAILIATLLITAGILLGKYFSEQKQAELDAYQAEMLDQLINRKGEYDEQSIVLTYTSKGTAEKLAETEPGCDPVVVVCAALLHDVPDRPVD
jgi:hypothetical protein